MFCEFEVCPISLCILECAGSVPLVVVVGWLPSGSVIINVNYSAFIPFAPASFFFSTRLFSSSFTRSISSLSDSLCMLSQSISLFFMGSLTTSQISSSKYLTSWSHSSVKSNLSFLSRSPYCFNVSSDYIFISCIAGLRPRWSPQLSSIKKGRSFIGSPQ